MLSLGSVVGRFGGFIDRGWICAFNGSGGREFQCRGGGIPGIDPLAYLEQFDGRRFGSGRI
ncbi:MAG: hypothetical protein IPP63_11755 [Chloracidobacterium sp.]|nr:hypothetical protein [Chloracidobacterium sp.]